MDLCDLVLIFLVSRGNGVVEERTLYTHHSKAERLLDVNTNGELIDVLSVRQFPCSEDPIELQSPNSLSRIPSDKIEY